MAKAYVFVKIIAHPQLDGPGAQKGDIVEILPVDQRCIGTGVVYNAYLPLIMKDLKIPCGDGVKDGFGVWAYNDRGPTYNCSKCPYNDIDGCDAIKYLKAEWSGGSLEVPPVLLKKRMHKIDYKAHIAISDSVLDKSNKTASDIQIIETAVKDNELLKIAIEVKK